MSKKTAKVPSPCVSVCKYKREGHCIACSMTKPQKKIFKRLKSAAEKAGFIELLEAQQAQMGRYEAWRILYERKLAKVDEKAARKARKKAAKLQKAA